MCLTLLLLSRYISFLPSGIDEDGDGHSGGEASGLWGEYDTHISVQSKQINNVVFIFGLVCIISLYLFSLFAFSFLFLLLLCYLFFNILLGWVWYTRGNELV